MLYFLLLLNEENKIEVRVLFVFFNFLMKSTCLQILNRLFFIFIFLTYDLFLKFFYSIEKIKYLNFI